MLADNIDVCIENLTEKKTLNDYKKCCQFDPFPSITPTFLNPIDIKKYIYSCGILYPYSRKNLTNATYKIPLFGDIYHWEFDKDEKKYIMQKESVSSDNIDSTITLKQNSITYFHISTIFRVPYYMVYRFNLTVSLAQKGLLLGTGPIVDPGFEGRIMIPIHNLTSNDYKLKVGSGLIRVEFTKISHTDYFIQAKNKGDYKYKFPESSKYLTATEYFKEINQNNYIVSSIPEAMQKSEKLATQAADNVKKIKKLAWVTAGISLFAIIVGMVYPTWSLISDTNSFYNKIENNILKVETKVESIIKENNKLKLEIQRLKKIKDKNETN